MFTFEDHMAQGQQAIKEILTVCTVGLILTHTALFLTKAVIVLHMTID